MCSDVLVFWCSWEKMNLNTGTHEHQNTLGLKIKPVYLSPLKQGLALICYACILFIVMD